jgi:hypothetical protein
MTSRRIFIRQLNALRRGRREQLQREMQPGRQIALEAGGSHATAEVGASCERKRAETLTPEAPMPMDQSRMICPDIAARRLRNRSSPRLARSPLWLLLYDWRRPVARLRTKPPISRLGFQ